MEERIFITAMGSISAIGNNIDEHLTSLLTGKTGIAYADYLQTIHSKEFPLGEIKMSNQELAAKLNLPQGNYSRTSLLALWSVRQLLENAALIPDSKTGLISASTVGGMDSSERHLDDYQAGEFLELAKQHPLGYATEFVAKTLNFKAYRTTLSTACSSSANAFILGSRIIRQGMLDRVVVGGVDALSAFTLNGFNSLMILDKEHCKPFDAERKGLNLGEAASYLLIETEKSMKAAGRKALAELIGGANVNDAYHQTASSPEGDGAFAAMQSALQQANISIEDISYINAHGTGTANNDLSEGRAMQRLLAGKDIPFSSTKALTGHTLAAAGALEAVISVLCLQNQFMPASVNFKNQMPELEITPIKKSDASKPIKNIISNSFGFGGNDSSLIFSKANI